VERLDDKTVDRVSSASTRPTTPPPDASANAAVPVSQVVPTAVSKHEAKLTPVAATADSVPCDRQDTAPEKQKTDIGEPATVNRVTNPATHNRLESTQQPATSDMDAELEATENEMASIIQNLLEKKKNRKKVVLEVEEVSVMEGKSFLYSIDCCWVR
jgi:hypothetical protein